MEDTLSYKSIAALSPEEQQRLQTYFNHRLSKITREQCDCSRAKRIRNSDSLCIDCQIDFWDLQASEAMRQIELLKEKKRAIQPPDKSDN